MRRPWFWIALSCICSVSILAQPPVRQLTSETRANLRGQKAFVLGPPLQCDSHGNIFILSMSTQAIEKISHDGENITWYPSPLLPDKPDARTQDLQVVKSGGLYALVLDSVKLPEGGAKSEPPPIPKGHIVHFTAGGSRDSDVVLDLSGFLPGNFVMTANSFIVLGTFIDLKTLQPGAPLRSENGAALFDLNGQFLRKLGGSFQEHRELPSAAQIATMVAGGDGNIYAKPPQRSIEKVNINVFSAVGSLLKTLKITPPTGEWYVADMKESEGRLAILYEKETALPDRTPTLLFRIQVVRTENGEEVAQYEATNLGMAFACYRGDTFTFLNIDKDQQLQIVQARAQ